MNPQYISALQVFYFDKFSKHSSGVIKPPALLNFKKQFIYLVFLYVIGIPSDKQLANYGLVFYFNSF